MRVLLFRTNGNVLDISKYNSQEIGLARALNKKGINCDIAYFNGLNRSRVQRYKQDDVQFNIFWMKGISIAGNGIFHKLNVLLKDYDIIQVSEYDQLTSLYLAFFSKYRKRVVIYHGPYLTEYNKKYRYKCRIIDRIPLSRNRKESIQCFAKSELAKDFLAERGFKNVLVTGVGLDIERIIEDASLDDNTLTILDQMNGNLNLLYIGNIEIRRNTKFLIEVASEVIKQKKNVKLIIIGSGDASYINECKKQIEEYGLSKKICFFNRIPQNQVRYIYANAHIFLLPTSYEIYGMVMMESMYYGLPVITTPSGGSQTVIEDGNNGYILNLDKHKWENTINNLLMSEDSRKQIGTNATATIKNKFTWDSIADLMIVRYRDISLLN